MVFQMDRIVLLVIFNVFLMVTGDNFREESMERAVRNGRARVVFTPIRGKRTYPENNRDLLLRMLEAADAVKYYYDQLPYYDSQADDPETKVTKKIIFTPKLGRSSEEFEAKRGYEADFTPRLGRQTDGVTASDDVYRQDGAQADSRSKNFSPRLGRTVELTPRLGRAYNYDMYPKVRIARSTNETKSA